MREKEKEAEMRTKENTKHAHTALWYIMLLYLEPRKMRGKKNIKESEREKTISHSHAIKNKNTKQTP